MSVRLSRIEYSRIYSNICQLEYNQRGHFAITAALQLHLNMLEITCVVHQTNNSMHVYCVHCFMGKCHSFEPEPSTLLELIGRLSGLSCTTISQALDNWAVAIIFFHMDQVCKNWCEQGSVYAYGPVAVCEIRRTYLYVYHSAFCNFIFDGISNRIQNQHVM